MEINQNQLAKAIGLSRAAVNIAIKRGQIEKNSAGLIDTQNTKNQQWLTARKISEQTIIQRLSEIPEKPERQPKTIKPSNPITELKQTIAQKQKLVESEEKPLLNTYEQESIEKPNKELTSEDFENCTGLPARMMSLTIKELVVKYGGPMMLDSWSKILQRLMAAQEKDQKIQERRLELIEKDFVISRIYSYLETLSSRLFDYTENIPVSMIALVKSEAENIELKIKEKMRKDFSILIKETKENVNRELDNLKTKYEKQKDDNNTNTEYQ